MREAGRLLNIVHKELEAAIRPGISTWELDKLGERRDPQLWLCAEFPEL